MINEQKLNRKERRALMFAGMNPTAQEQHKEGTESVKRKMVRYETKVIRENFDEGVIYIPEIDRFHCNIMPYMIPEEDIDVVYTKSYWRSAVHPSSAENEGTAKVPADYHHLVNDWFFRGMEKIEFHFKDTVRTVEGASAPQVMRRAFLAYIGTILRSWYPGHNHKISYVVYCLDMCCTQVDWKSAADSKE